ncbi:MAG TPA: peptide deformylase [Candidatus Omnitrophota bacterium]|nr:peptide deformylase [Candidatus Omnitrophota bacterium]HRK61559.1 peptide deformylase [Candidatus Omnitrophota bacterium]
MAILPIRTYPDPVLTQKAKLVEVFDKKMQRFFDDMIDTMYTDDGVGLAAPQVGVSKQILIASPQNQPGTEIVICNPVIETSGGTQMGPEGCLSFPGVFADVPRAQWIQLRYQDRKGQTVVVKIEDFFARIVQHEMDHLNGFLLIDRVNLVTREKLLAEYAAGGGKKKKKR